MLVSPSGCIWNPQDLLWNKAAIPLHPWLDWPSLAKPCTGLAVNQRLTMASFGDNTASIVATHLLAQSQSMLVINGMLQRL